MPNTFRVVFGLSPFLVIWAWVFFVGAEGRTGWIGRERGWGGEMRIPPKGQ